MEIFCNGRSNAEGYCRTCIHAVGTTKIADYGDDDDGAREQTRINILVWAEIEHYHLYNYVYHHTNIYMQIDCECVSSGKTLTYALNTVLHRDM